MKKSVIKYRSFLPQINDTTSVRSDDNGHIDIDAFHNLQKK